MFPCISVCFDFLLINMYFYRVKQFEYLFCLGALYTYMRLAKVPLLVREIT